MTVLDESRMSSSLGGDRYITPEYLAPLPQKDGHSDKSPLQMLAQTCSQIGADSGPKMADKQKSITSGELKSGKGGNQAPKSSSPTIIVSDGGPGSKPVPFKPYEITKDGGGGGGKIESRKSSINSSEGGRGGGALGGSPLLGSGSRSPGSGENGMSRTGTSPRTTSSSSETTPTLSSGMEILAGHPKDLPLGTFRPPGPAGAAASLEAHLNPAFRLGSGALGAAGLPGFPSPSSVAGSVCRDPYCKDPNCPTAVYNAYMSRLSAARGLPPGYLELMEAHKMAALGLGGLGAASPPPPPTSLASASAAAALGPGGPYICNWMNGRDARDYCGKRFTSAEELLVHLKTHTNLSASDSSLGGLNASAAAAAAAAAASSSSAAYAGLLGAASASLMGARGAAGAPGGPVLPSSLSLGAGRYSPYQRPPGAPMPPSLSPMVGTPGGFPPSLAASLHPSFASLAAGYPASLYALYGARL